jgi:hypothetical protein
MGNGVYRVSGFLLVNAIPNSTVGAIKYNTQSTKGFTISGWQFEEGSTASVFTPYAVQVNPKPKKWVPKKNLFDGQLELGAYRYSDGVKIITSTYARSVNPMVVTPNLSLSLSMAYAYGTDCGFIFFDKSMSFISSAHPALTTTVPSNAYYVHINIYGTNAGNVVLSDIKSVQVEYGTATTYEPYQLVTPKAKTGLSFNGVTDYLQLPSMTMDSVEIECLIDSVQLSTGRYLLDARNGLSSGYIYDHPTVGIGSSWSSLTVDGINKPSKLWGDIPKGQRTKVKVTASSSFTDDVTIFNFNSGSGVPLKGTLYKVTCYLNNAIVAQYDFENNRAMAGSSVVPVVTGGSKNYIQDVVMTKGYNLGNASSTSDVYRVVSVSVKPGTYTAKINNPNYPGLNFRIVDSASVQYGGTYANQIETITVGTTTTLYLNLRYTDSRSIPQDIKTSDLQLQFEEGSTPTAYSPYQWQTATNPLNLIPSFEDARWTIHANAKVLGRDVLHLDATATSQVSEIYIPCLPNTNYKFSLGGYTGNYSVSSRDINKNIIGGFHGSESIAPSGTVNFTSASNAVYLRIAHGNSSAGSFDFIRPQLYQLSGKEGTLNGSPIQLNKHAKRRLYAKR